LSYSKDMRERRKSSNTGGGGEPALPARPVLQTEEEGDTGAGNSGVVAAVLEGPNFTGEFVLDVAASDDPSEMLTALGVPWIARKAIAKTSRTLYIEHDGLSWVETIVAPLITKTMQFSLDGTPSIEISPVDKSAITSVSSVDGDTVVTNNDYGEGNDKSQLITRRLAEEGRLYLVENKMTINAGQEGKEKVIFTVSRFNRVKQK